MTLGAPASNVTTTLGLPETRWTLFAAGGGVGPAVLYWAELIVFIVLAVLLGRFAGSPLGTRDWLLVGLGLSTFSWTVLLLFAAWTFAMQWRKRWQDPVAPWVFNLVQVGLAVFTIVALGSLVAAIPNGLARHARHAHRRGRQFQPLAHVVPRSSRERVAATGGFFGLDMVLQGGHAGLGVVAQLRTGALGARRVGCLYRRPDLVFLCGREGAGSAGPVMGFLMMQRADHGPA